MCFISLYDCSKNFLCINIEFVVLKVHAEMHVGLHVKCFLLFDLNQNPQYHVSWKYMFSSSQIVTWTDRCFEVMFM
jgi:hypothetical protein